MNSFYMEPTGIKHIEQLLEFSGFLSIENMEVYILNYVERRSDASVAMKELDERIALAQNRLKLFSLYLKQNHLIGKPTPRVESVEYYTKQEVANKFRVSVRTVTNWIIDGLEVEEIGGVKRISENALREFSEVNRRKKFAWRSIAG